MTTYSLIIKNIIDTEKNLFSLIQAPSKVDYVFKILFTTLLVKNLSVKDKFSFFIKSLDNFYIKNNKENEFIEHFCKIQKTYHTLNRFVNNYKYKKAEIVVNTDMCMNELNINDKNVICLFHNNSKYLFHINDLIKIINSSLTNSYSFFSDPKCIKNPYDNIPFNKSTLYNIYFYIKYKTTYSPDLFIRFFQANFNLTLFKDANECLLREYIISNYVYKSPSNILVNEIKKMLLYFNKYCEECFIKGKITIDKEFPKDILIKIMQPYLLLFIKSHYSLFKKTREDAIYFLHKYLLRFHYYNPQFGRKKYKIIVKTTPDYRKRVSGKVIEFDDKHIQFNNIEIQNKNFLSDHLNYEELDDFYNRTIFTLSINSNFMDIEEDDGYSNPSVEENRQSELEENRQTEYSEHEESDESEDEDEDEDIERNRLLEEESYYESEEEEHDDGGSIS